MTNSTLIQKEENNTKNKPCSAKILHRLLLWYIGPLEKAEILWAWQSCSSMPDLPPNQMKSSQLKVHNHECMNVSLPSAKDIEEAHQGMMK